MTKNEFVVHPEKKDLNVRSIVQDIDRGYQLQGISIDEINQEKNSRLEYIDCIILKPFYQREYRFSVAEESALIESVLVGIPIPPIFLSSTRLRGVQVLDVVDGQHRLTAFYRFRKGEFPLTGLALLSELNGKKFEDLDTDKQETILTYALSAYVFRDFPGKEFELEVFSRYNKGTKTLTPQEIRNAVYSSPYNEYVSDFVSELNGDKKSALAKAYNVTTDRYQKKKVHEGVFTIWSVLNDGINTNYKDSTEYADEYMKKCSEFCSSHGSDEIDRDLKARKNVFENFNDWIEECTSITPYPFSKEIYGISSTSYKFQTSMAMILAAIYRKVYILKECGEVTQEQLLNSMKNSLLNSFLEDSNYSASTTNSSKIKEFVDSFSIQ